MRARTRLSLRKKLLRSVILHYLLSFLVSVVMRLIYLTCRIEKQFPEITRPYFDGEKPAVYCFWHGRMIMHPFMKPPGRSMSVLISNHNDGALINATMRWFGIGSVRGSKRMGGGKALLNLLKVTQAGGNIAITPDGPRGPFQVAAPGAAYVAAKTRYPLIPVSFSATRTKRFRSWDRFMIPLPFSRIIFMVGPPFFVADDGEATIQAATAILETTLQLLTERNDTTCGVSA